MSAVVLDEPIRLTDRAKAKVIRPAGQAAIDAADLRFHVPQRLIGSCQRADLAADPLDLLPRRARADVGPARAWRVTATKGVTQEVERLASASRDGTVKIWDFETAKELLSFNVRGMSSARSVAFSPDGECLAFSNENGIYLWETMQSLERLQQTK
jgi:WD40 repeat protein